MSKCPICDKSEIDIAYVSIDYPTGLTFCNDHLNDAESLYRRVSLAGTTDLSSWLRCIADIRDDYHKHINSDKMHTDKVIDINKVNGYTPINSDILMGKILDIFI